MRVGLPIDVVAAVLATFDARGLRASEAVAEQ